MKLRGSRPVGELAVFDLVHRPGQALHQALSGLPRAVPFGTAERVWKIDPSLPAYEQQWRRAAHATIGLEGYLGTVGRLPDQHAWAALRDLADLAAALPALDHGLSEALLPGLEAGEDLAVPYRLLTHPGHDLVRLAAAEVRARVPAHEDSAPNPPGGAARRRPSRHRGAVDGDGPVRPGCQRHRR